MKNTAKTELRGNFIAINAYVKKEERSQIEQPKFKPKGARKSIAN